jgi:DNA-binding transcriptional LysR family regulator
MNILDFDWTLIKTFLAACDERSLQGAARRLGMSQPTVGRHVDELERQLNAALFERTGRGLIPTAMALALESAARKMEAAASELALISRGGVGGLAGAVRVSASQPIACELLPPLLTKMRTTLPLITIELVVSNAVSNLLKREADIALRMVQPEQAHVIAKKIGTVTLGAYAHADYLRRRGAPTALTDLQAHDFIGPDRGDEVEQGLAKLGVAIHPSQFSVRTDDLIAQIASVRQGLGIGFISNYIGRNDANLVPIFPQFSLPSFPLWLVVHREIRNNKSIRAVFDFLGDNVPKSL